MLTKPNLVILNKGIFVDGQTVCSCNHVLCRNQGSSAVLLLACLTHNCNLPGPCSRGGNLSTYNLSKKATPSTGWVFNFFYPTGESGRGRWRARGNVLLRRYFAYERQLMATATIEPLSCPGFHERTILTQSSVAWSSFRPLSIGK